MLFQHFSFHLFVGLFHFLHLFLSIVHNSTEILFACNTLVHDSSACCTKDMSTLYFYWAFKLIFTFITNFINFVLFYGFECLLNILFGSKLRVTDSSPSLLFGPLKIPFLLPSCFIIGPVVKIDTTVTEWTVTRIMPIFTQSKVVIKPTGVSYSTVYP